MVVMAVDYSFTFLSKTLMNIIALIYVVVIQFLLLDLFFGACNLAVMVEWQTR